METQKRLLIVSFGDSDKYRYEYTTPVGASIADHKNPLAPVEQELRATLEREFPGEPCAWLASARATEVAWAHRDRYAAYPLLDAAAVDRIKRVLIEEMRARIDLHSLNSDAPFSAVANANY